MRAQTTLRALFTFGVALLISSCDTLMEVENPTVIDARAVNPSESGRMFSFSALTNLYNAFNNYVYLTAYFSSEAHVGAIAATRNDIGRRQVDNTNGTLNGSLFAPLSLAIATGEQVQQLLEELPESSSSLALARGAFASGMAIQLEAEAFCQVVISSGLDDLGAPISPEEALDEAISRFQTAIDAALAANQRTPSDEALAIANVARVGLARAYLQQGAWASAAAAAATVPPDFVFYVPRVDDPSNRDLGNAVYEETLPSPELVVPPYIRSLDDPRLPYELEIRSDGRPAETLGNFMPLWKQMKYTDWGADIPLASGLLARYIQAEAQLKLGDPAAAEALIAERRLPGVESGEEFDFLAERTLLAELLDQKTRDFYLEGVHMGDWRRNPQDTPYVIPAGEPFWVPELGLIGSQTCLPVPADEVDNNPNFAARP